MNPASRIPERIFFNGRIHTLDLRMPIAPALAVAGGRIMMIGDDDTIRAAAAPGTEQIDLEGRLVLPGLTDVHFHVYEWAMNRRHLALADADALETVLRRVKDAAAGRPEGSWIIGQGWNETDWHRPVMPTRTDLDAAAPRHPVILWRCDLHLAAANSAALARAGIGPDTPDPPEGRIDRAADGTPTGILRELAINLVRAVMPPPTDPEIRRALKAGIAELHAMGITGVHDVRLMNDGDGAAAYRAWQALHREGELAMRCWVTVPGERMDEMIALGLQTGWGDDRLRMGHLKFFSDGGMGARTAWVIDPYQDGGTGMPLIPLDELTHLIQKADQAGLAVMVHTVGDRSARELVGILEGLQGERKAGQTGPALPHRLEHVQMIRPADARRLGRLPVAASMQPHNMVLDMNLVDGCIGERGRWVYAFRTLMESGVPVMFSSDAPVADPDPIKGIHAAVTRCRADGTPPGGWYPEQRISVDQAVRAYTQVPAAAHGLEGVAGCIAPGKWADFIALDRDIFAIPPTEIHDTAVVMTVLDGRIVTDRR